MTVQQVQRSVVWKTKTLGSILVVLRNGLNCKQDKSGNGEKISRIESISDATFNPEKVGYTNLTNNEKERFLLQQGDILFSHINSPIHVGKTAIFDCDEPIYHGVNLLLMRPNDEITPEYLNLALKYLFQCGYWRGVCKQSVNQASVNQQDISRVEISYPASKAEQQRIIAILDEAFAAIATARVSAERNLQNTRELFESYLQSVFSQRGDGWEEKRLGEIANIEYGFTDKAKNKGYYRFIRITDINNSGTLVSENKVYVDFSSEAEKFLLKDGDLLMARTGATFAKVLLYENYEKSIFASYLIRISFTERIENKLYWYFSKSKTYWEQANQLASGAAQPQFNGGALKQIVFSYPKSISEQQTIVAELDALSEETQRLEDVYRRKIAALDELKKSLLEQAFKGELTGRIAESVTIPFPVHVPNISTTDLHAGILALAYQMHEKSGKQKNFGHVKAEKIAHMIEAYVGIELDRAPVKDAAGPNDYQHLKKIEHRAKMAGFFTFHEQTGGGYIMTKAGGFDSLVNKTRTALGDLNKKVDDLINLMLPMDTQQAEIFATVYAAWNNLLIDKENITGERIVSEARENWHPDKLKIPRERFFAAITWLRDKEIIPKGLGKKVTAKVPKP